MKSEDAGRLGDLHELCETASQVLHLPMASSGRMSDDTGSSGTALRRSTRSETRETIELAVIAWACCLAVVAAIAIPLLGLAQAALIAGGALVGLVAACFAISGARLPRRSR